MPRQSLNVEGRTGGKCKIRKRGCSSSSSSSLLKNYRMKRAILVGKRGGSSTPVPIWKLNLRSPPITLHNPKSMQFKTGGEGKEMPVSARKLAATLWEINEVPSPGLSENLEEKRKTRDRIVKHFADPSDCLVSEKVDGSKVNGQRRRISVGSQKLMLSDYNLEGLDSAHIASLAEEIEPQIQGHTSCRHIVGVRNRLKQVSNGLTTSKELLKVLNHICYREEKHSTSLSLLSALKMEIERAHIQVNKLTYEQQYNHNEIEYVLKQFEEEKAAWKIKERDRTQNIFTSIAGELEVEKKLRRQTERLNKKLGRELADTKASLSKTLKELESEKRAREILEQVCDELARGIEEDRVDVEELKRQSEKVREEVEKEREMLQLADLLREERVQMKLSEAKYQFEEKNAAVDELRNEFEVYLRTKRTKTGETAGSPNHNRIKELEEYLREILQGSYQNREKKKDEGVVVNGEEGEGDDSADSELHSIELNMDNNSKSYEWNYTCGDAAQNDSKRISDDDKIKGRKSISDRTQRRGVLLERKILDGIEWEFDTGGRQENSDDLDRDRFSELASQAWRKDREDEIERYKMIKDLRDHIVSGSRIASSQGFASCQPLLSQDPSGVVHGGFTVLQDAV